MARRSEKALAEQIRPLLDPGFYVGKYPDIEASGLDPLTHYVRFGTAEGRDPNPFFDGAWYRAQNPDVATSGMDPLLHYMQTGAGELRNPHPHFDAAYYAEAHPEAAANPLLFHLLAGRRLGYATEPPFDIADFLPSKAPRPVCPPRAHVDVVIPCYRGLAETRRCILSVLADPERPPGRVIAIDDCSPEPALSRFLRDLAADGRIVLLRNARNLGFVASANRGIAEAGRADVALLNSDTEVPPGWLSRLAWHAYAEPDVASVSPWSNNATICSYPSLEGGPPAFGLSLRELDRAAQEANAGRHVAVPVTVGFCMYVRRAALDAVGAFDEAAFGRGYGEECDFCWRAAARGWRHLLACDTYVHHEAEISFGARASKARAAGDAALAARWPDHARRIERHVLRGTAEPFRFALTAALYRRSGLPVILMVSHALGGGVDRHIALLAAALEGKANLLVLQPSGRGALISAPSLPGHGTAAIPAERVEDIAAALRSAGVRRVHVHHVIGADFNLRRLIRLLGIPFDLTIHDYFLVCPQVNLLPVLEGQYCGEPEQAGCNRCIARRPSNGAEEILDWRTRHAWLLREADRVLCPSEDVRARLARYAPAARLTLAPHEPAPPAWSVRRPRLRRGEALRVALLGVLAAQKGLPAVSALARAADPARVTLHLIGYPERKLPRGLRSRIRVSGPYSDKDLPALLDKLQPHVVWFPAQWPETWSYTLSAALEAGLPVVASAIGAFPERLEGRPLTWLVDPDASTEAWLAAFEGVRAALRAGGPVPPARRRELGAFYPEAYLRPLSTPALSFAASRRPLSSKSVPPAGEIAAAEKPLKVVAIPERFETTGTPTPCAYIRLLQPLTHPQAASGVDLVVAGVEEALDQRADLIVTHRNAIRTAAEAETLARHCHETGAALAYDLDDDLLHVPKAHPDAGLLRARAGAVRRMLERADTVWVSTPRLARLVAPIRPDARVLPNALDERLWFARGLPPLPSPGWPVRILFMGTSTHDDDFALVEPALERLVRAHPDRVRFDLIGISLRDDLPAWVTRVAPQGIPAHSYPAFVNWITAASPSWDVGIAPLADSAFARAKSAIKTLDYAALGLATLASDVEPYRHSVADGAGGTLVANDPDAWFEALDRMVRLERTRRNLAEGGRKALLDAGTLAAQAADRQAALRAAALARSASAGVPSLSSLPRSARDG